jgi:hypothetical protein
MHYAELPKRSWRCFIVATCDMRRLRGRVRKIPGVPCIYVSGSRYTVERIPQRPSGHRDKVKGTLSIYSAGMAAQNRRNSGTIELKIRLSIQVDQPSRQSPEKAWKGRARLLFCTVFNLTFQEAEPRLAEYGF